MILRPALEDKEEVNMDKQENVKPLSLLQVIILVLALGPGLALALGAATRTVDILFWCCIPIIGVYLLTRK